MLSRNTVVIVFLTLEELAELRRAATCIHGEMLTWQGCFRYQLLPIALPIFLGAIFVTIFVRTDFRHLADREDHASG